jgi:uncharacterized protein
VTTHLAFKRHTARISRWLHIYGSMLSFSVVLFFSVTGITLNHPGWLAAAERRAQQSGQIDLAWLAVPETPDARLRIVEHLRATHGLSGAVSDFRMDEVEASISFKGPGYAADVFIARATGRYELTETRLGLVAVMNDLHKGRDSGEAWSWLIDLSAALLIFVSLTGLVLLYFLHKHRTAGVMLIGVGTVATWCVYAALVP